MQHSIEHSDAQNRVMESGKFMFWKLLRYSRFTTTLLLLIFFYSKKIHEVHHPLFQRMRKQ